MTRLVAAFGTAWPAWLLLALAAVTVAALGRRLVWPRWVAGALAALGVGGLALNAGPVDLAGWATVDPAVVTGLVGAAGLLLAGFVLLVFRAWSFGLGVTLGVLLLAGVGGLVVRPAGAGVAEALGSVTGVQFVRPQWLFLLLVVPLIPLISRRTLSGLGPTRKWTAVGLRTAGVALLALALAEPRLKRPTDSTTVLFLVDRSFSVPQDVDNARPDTATVDRRWQNVRAFIEASVKKRPPDKKGDRSGLVLFGKRPKLALPPTDADFWPVDERLAGPIDGNYTDIAAALKLALASFPEGTGKRIVLISDGNENVGVAEEQARVAARNGVQIDAVALAPGYRNESDILVQGIEAPQVVAQGQRLPVRVMVRNATPNTVVDGRLDLLKTASGQPAPVEMEDGPQVLDARDAKVRLLPGLNVFKFRNKVEPGQQPDEDQQSLLRATFTPFASRPVTGGAQVAGLPGDRTANNRAEAVVIGRGRRQVLLIDEDGSLGQGSPHAYFLDTLRTEPNPKGGPPVPKFKVLRTRADKLPQDKGELAVFLSDFDAVILANVPYERFTADQAEVIRAAVYDQGCGLVMIGGPDSFGAGGYQGTKIEEALPVDCEIKALKAAGKGGLVLVMHASEMADGNKWQKEIAKLAIQRLGPADMVGVVQYDGFGGAGQGVKWHIPFQQVGEQESANRNRILSQLDALTPGDMPDFDPFLTAAYDTLSNPKYGLSVKHAIVISDGDPNYSGPGQTAVKNMAAGGVTCSTIGVATHGGAEKSKLKLIAEGTNDGAGNKGNFYDITNPNQLPAIYIKESRRVSQSFLIKDPFTPVRTGPVGASDVLAPGLPADLPRFYGMVRTTKKENVLSNMSLRGPVVKGPDAAQDQVFPVLASWRYGLGKSVAFTADARTQPGGKVQYWDKDWAGSDVYRKFWDQVINWAMREPERGRLTLVTEYRDGKVRVTADVRDERDKPVGGVTLKAEVTLPAELAAGEKKPAIEFRAKGNGQFEAEFAADEAGAYFLNVVGTKPDGDRFDSARAGVTVPYSPEFADLESNAPLLARLATITNGKYHTDADDLQALAASGDVFRDAAAATRSVLPFWFWLVFAAAVLLVFDVGVRRIAVEPAEVESAATRAWRRLRTGAAGAVTTGDANLDRLLGRKRATGVALDENKARRRFDAPSLPVEAPEGADGFAARTTAATAPAAARTSEQPATPDDANDPLARLRKARDRAREQQRRDRLG